MEGIYRVSGVGGFRIDLVLVALACDLIGDGFGKILSCCLFVR
jgi:hypothetical protein